MPPKPIEDIDFPDLSEKLLEVLRALWTLIVDICLTVWFYLSEAFSAVWTYPPFEAFRNEFAAALIGLMDYVVAHPVTATVLFVLAFIVIPTLFSGLWMSLLYCFGFRKQGVLRDFHATNYQSTSCGGNVPRGSTFTRLQSQGARDANGYRVVGGTGSPNWR